MPDIRRGDVFYACLGLVTGSEQGGVRPVLIIQNDIGNKYSPTVIVAPITSSLKEKANLPTHAFIPVLEGTGLTAISIVLLEQIRTIDKTRLLNRIGCLDADIMDSVNTSICISVGIPLLDSPQQ